MATTTEVKYALKRPGIFPGWVMSLWTWNTYGLMYGCYMYSWSVFTAQLLRLKLVTSADIAVATALGRFEGGLEAVPAGYLIDTWGPRNMHVITLILGGLGYILLGMWLVPEGWWVWLTFGLIVNLSLNATAQTYPKIFTWWFIRRRATAIALNSTGAAVWGTFFVPATAALITGTNWQMAAYAQGGALVVFGILSYFFLHNGPPAAYGLLPDNEKLPHERTKEELEAARAKGSTKVMTADDFLPHLGGGDALKTRAFWALVLAGAFGGFWGFAVPMFATAHIRSLGYTLQESAQFFALFLPFTLVGRFLVAGLADRYGGQRFLGGGYLGVCVGLLLLAFASKQQEWMLWLYGPFYGIPFGMLPAVSGHVYASWFGRKWYATVNGLVRLIDTPVVGFGTIIMGVIADLAGGSYVLSFVFVVINIVIAGLSILVVGTTPKQMKEAYRKAREHGIRITA